MEKTFSELKRKQTDEKIVFEVAGRQALFHSAFLINAINWFSSQHKQREIFKSIATFI